MLSRIPNPEPELTHDELTHQLFGTDTNANADGYVVFSLGPDYEDATLDAYGNVNPVQRTA